MLRSVFFTLCFSILASTAYAQDCVESPVSLDTIREKLESDSNIRSMRPWTLTQVSAEACLNEEGQLPLHLEFISSRNTAVKSKLSYAHSLDLLLDVEKVKTINTDPSVSKHRSAIEKVIKAIDKDPFVEEVLAAAPKIEAVLNEKGKVEIPEHPDATATLDSAGKATISFSDGVVLGWSDGQVAALDLPTDKGFMKMGELLALEAIVPTMVEGKSCEMPARVQGTKSLSDRSWTFTFTLQGECAGSWQLVMQTDGSYESSKQ